jgi:mxaJ protein
MTPAPRFVTLSAAKEKVVALAAITLGLAVAVAGASIARPHAKPVLRVCADPNNLPYSNERGEGFENALAQLVARDIGKTVEYTWWAQRRGFLRSTLKDSLCDVVMGVQSSNVMVRRTKPYYRSTYVFVTKRSRKLELHSLDDPRLRKLRIGVPLVGDDYASTPPAAAMIKRGLAGNLVSFSVYGDYGQPNPPAKLIEAVRTGDVDVAMAWGPLAGYFARDGDSSLVIEPVTPQIDLPFMPMTFDIAMGVRQSDSVFAARLDSIIDLRRGAIDSLLATYNVPRLDRVKQ